MAKHFLVFGATGPTGLLFVEAALKAGHQLTILARTPSKLPADVISHPKVVVIEGQVADAAVLQAAAKSGADAFVSFAGPVSSSKGTPITDAYQVLLPLLIENGIRRALILSTPSFDVPQDQGALKWKAAVWLIRLIGGSAWEEVRGIGATVSSQPLDQLQWTLFRVGFLTNGPAGPVEATFTGSGKDGLGIHRASIADWVLHEADANQWVGQAPLLSNK